MIFTQVKNIMKSLFSQRAEHEALVAYDFKLTDFKTSLMALCFSPLANWILLVWALLLHFNPYRYQFQLLGGLSGAISFIYSPHWQIGLSFGIICSYFLGAVNIPIAVALYLISQGEIHTIIAGSLIVGVFFGRSLRYLKLSVKLESQTKRTVLYFAFLQFVSLAAATIVSLWIYEYMNAAGYFSRTLFAYRFEFIVISLMVNYLMQFVVNVIWGHFYSRKTDDPSQLKTYYSTALVLRRLSLSRAVKDQLKQQAMNRHTELKDQLNDASTSYLPQNILQAAQKEKVFLELSQKTLS